MTRSESRTLVTTALVLLAASAVRYAVEVVRPVPEIHADTASVEGLLAASRDAAREAERRARPLAAGERIDVNSAPEEELDRLPGVGPAVARAIVEEREHRGPFAGPGDLTRVRGVGSASASRIAPFLAFSTPGAGTPSTGTPAPRTGGRTPGAPGGYPDARLPVNLNLATEAELMGVRGIGPVLARRIVEVRTRLGGFRRVEDLVEVPGIGPVTLARLRGSFVVGRSSLDPWNGRRLP